VESSGTPEFLELDSKGKNTLPWGVLGVIEKVLKCKCPKWPRIGHLDICSPSYRQKKGRESNWLFDSRPLKVGNRPAPDVRLGSATLESSWKGLQVWFRRRPDRRSGREAMMSQSPKSPKSGQFRDSILGVPGRTTTWVWARRSNVKNTIGRMVMTLPESRPWCVMWVWVSPWLVWGDFPSLYSRFYKVIMHGSTNATNEGRIQM
jgi:hypothetical protein